MVAAGVLYHIYFAKWRIGEINKGSTVESIEKSEGSIYTD